MKFSPKRIRQICDIVKDMFTSSVFNAKDVSVIRVARFCLGGKTHVMVLLLISKRDPVQTESQSQS